MKNIYAHKFINGNMTDLVKQPRLWDMYIYIPIYSYIVWSYANLYTQICNKI